MSSQNVVTEEHDVGISTQQQHGGFVWLITFGDLLTLLVCFFLVMLPKDGVHLKAKRELKQNPIGDQSNQTEMSSSNGTSFAPPHVENGMQPHRRADDKILSVEVGASKSVKSELALNTGSEQVVSLKGRNFAESTPAAIKLDQATSVSFLAEEFLDSSTSARAALKEKVSKAAPLLPSELLGKQVSALIVFCEGSQEGDSTRPSFSKTGSALNNAVQSAVSEDNSVMTVPVQFEYFAGSCGTQGDLDRSIVARLGFEVR